MFKNKHVTLALLIAPLLAIIAFFATDYMVSETPQLAEAGSSYTLAAKPNCRYQSGRCSLKNKDVEFEITFPQKNTIQFNANISLIAVEIRILKTAGPDSTERIALQHSDEQRKNWFSALPATVESSQTLQLVVDTGEGRFFHETDLIFIDSESQFSR